MKNLLAIGLGVALAAEIALFAGIGFGTGALAVAPVANASTTVSDGCFSWQVVIQSPGNLPYYVSNWANGVSTPISFYVQFSQSSSCGTDVWSSSTSYFIVSVAGEKLNASSNGGGVNYAVYSYNGTNTYGQSCVLGSCVPKVGAFTETIYPTTITIQGQYTDFSTLNVQYFGGQACRIFSSTGSGCTAINPYSQATLRNGGAQFTSVPRTVFNGQSFQTYVTTYYDDGHGFNVQFLYPATRGSTLISQQNVGDSCTNCPVTFTAPSNASVLSNSISNIQFQLVIYAPIAQEAYQTVYIDISPNYAPPAPSITFQDSAHSPAQVGDSASILLSASGNATTGKISQFVLWAWYLFPGASSTSMPSITSNAWITSGTQNGQSISATSSSLFNATGSFPFQVSQAYSIAVQAISGTSNGQAAVAPATEVIQVLPANCQAQGTCQRASNAFWTVAGPILLSAAIVTASALIAVLVPVGMAARVAIVALAAGGVVVLYLFAFGTWFAPGGVF